MDQSQRWDGVGLLVEMEDGFNSQSVWNLKEMDRSYSCNHKDCKRKQIQLCNQKRSFLPKKTLRTFFIQLGCPYKEEARLFKRKHKGYRISNQQGVISHAKQQAVDGT